MISPGLRWLWALVFYYLCSGYVFAQQVNLQLRENVLLQNQQIRLGDLLAAIDGASPQLRQELAQLLVGDAPMTGYVDKRNRQSLENVIRRHFFHLQPVWSGAQQVVIRSQAQSLMPNLAMEVARNYLQGLWQAQCLRLELKPLSILTVQDLPIGEVQYEVRPLADKQLRARVVVAVDVIVRQQFYKTLKLVWDVQAWQNVFTAKRQLSPGEYLQESDFALQEVDLAQLSTEAVRDKAVFTNHSRLRQGINKGQVLSTQVITTANMVLRGDKLKLQISIGDVLVETDAQALTDAQVGQWLQVKAVNSTAPVQARVISHDLVRVEDR